MMTRGTIISIVRLLRVRYRGCILSPGFLSIIVEKDAYGTKTVQTLSNVDQDAEICKFLTMNNYPLYSQYTQVQLLLDSRHRGRNLYSVHYRSEPFPNDALLTHWWIEYGNYTVKGVWTRQIGFLHCFYQLL